MKCAAKMTNPARKLFEIYEKHLKIAIDTTAKGINLHLDHAWEVTPELIMNLMMYNTIEKGEDISQVARLYTVGVDGAGLAVVADSFAAMQTRIEEEKRLTWDELYAALDNNFADERTRLMLNSTPKYCHGNTTADKWAVKLTKILGAFHQVAGNAKWQTTYPRLVFLGKDDRIRFKSRRNAQRQAKRRADFSRRKPQSSF